MSRDIDADKLKRKLENTLEKMHIIGGVHAVDLGAVIESLNRQPSADVVEVVRCKDCIFCRYVSSADIYKCDRRGYFSEEVDPNDFCSKAKKKGEDGE
jgi:hypothetical protein